MTILSDKDIENYMKNNELGIEPFNQKNLTPNGYDLSIDEIYIKKSDQHITTHVKESWQVLGRWMPAFMEHLQLVVSTLMMKK
jgi:deoxycytidine triphosphate deaminase